MSDLKRKRGLLEGDTGSADGANIVSYFNNLPEGLVELADVKLLVEAKELLAHSFVLTRSSPVLLTAVTAASKESQRVCQVPLPGETVSGVTLLLKYLYQDTLVIESINDASTLVRFAHKYNMARILELSSKYLVDNVQTMLSHTTVFGWAAFADKLHLGHLLALCEHYIALNFRIMSSQQRKISSMSDKSLQRVMDCLAGTYAPGKVNDCMPFDAKFLTFCDHCETLSDLDICNCSQSYRARNVRHLQKGAVIAIAKAMVPPVETLLRLQEA